MALDLCLCDNRAMSKDHIENVERMQEFKRRLAALLTEFNAALVPGFSGDTHGIEEEWLEIHVGDDYTCLDTTYESCVEATTIEATIGTEVQYVKPVPPPYIDPYSVFPVGTEVQYREAHLKTLHSGWMRLKGLRGIVVPRSGSGLNPLNKNYLYVEWPNQGVKGHKAQDLETPP
jgi:hypothetical protein